MAIVHCYFSCWYWRGGQPWYISLYRPLSVLSRYPLNGAWFNIYSVTYTFLLLSLQYGWWLNFYVIFFLLWLAWNEYFFLAFNIFGTSPMEYIIDLTVFDGFSLDAWGSQSPASLYIYILRPPLKNCSFALSQNKLLKPWLSM